FSNLLGNNFKYVAEAISHEAGHTLGLQHQSSYDANCNFLSEYNSGAGTGEIGWAPIMGVGYQRNLTLWHNGSSSLGCGSVQNDATLITSTSNGITYRNDDIGNTIQESTPITINGNAFNTSGFINNTNDVDVFSYALTQRGQFTLQAIPFNTGNNSTSANIDIKVDLLSSGGNLLRSINPAAQVSASLDTTLDAGNYFLRVSNVSNANVSNYGMLGSYALTGTLSAANTNDTNLIMQSVNLSGQVRNSRHELWWTTVSNEPLAYVSLQRSLDGRSFVELFRSTGGATSYVYAPQETTLIYYRAVATTSSNKLITSNIISLRSKTKSSKTRLITNQVSNQIGWISDAPSDWRLMDATGNIVLKGRFTAGTNYIAVSHLDAGIYFLQTIEDGSLKTHKIMKY
ncbi:MAG: zinc-dependent metalloprotease, partial [Chitinophagaceae bacterium]